ncbi:MAG: hypothetical protein JXB49_05265 [Bacteroidales bacterium]|nr:hypothetical protein [Bacteroidales bacterium]
MIEGYEFWQLFPLVHKIGCYPTIYYECKYEEQEKEYEITIHWVDGFEFTVFENTLRDEIDRGILKAQVKINEISDIEAKDMISDFKRGARQCRRLISEYKSHNSVYPYFSHASFDDDMGNKVYESMTKDANFLNLFNGTSSIIKSTDLIEFDKLLLHIHTVHFAKVFINVVDYLDEKIDDLNISLSNQLHSKENQSKYELILNNKHSSKELTYLFNLLSRIRFFKIREGDHEKLYRLIADLYKSQRGSKANKAKTIKNNWTSSSGHTIEEPFLTNFKEKVLKEMMFLVQDDIAHGYNPKRMAKLNQPE